MYLNVVCFVTFWDTKHLKSYSIVLFSNSVDISLSLYQLWWLMKNCLSNKALFFRSFFLSVSSKYRSAYIKICLLHVYERTFSVSLIKTCLKWCWLRIAAGCSLEDLGVSNMCNKYSIFTLFIRACTCIFWFTYGKYRTGHAHCTVPKCIVHNNRFIANEE